MSATHATLESGAELCGPPLCGAAHAGPGVDVWSPERAVDMDKMPSCRRCRKHAKWNAYKKAVYVARWKRAEEDES